MFVLLSLSPLCCQAQFYTLGPVSQHRSLHIVNHPEQLSLAPKDSLDMSDSVGESCQISLIPLVSFPLKQIKVVSKFGMRYHPVFHKKMMHNGVDLAANYEVVYSMFPGRVVQVGNDKRSGNFVIVKTDCYTVSYCHLSKVFVHQGDFVEAGTPICRSGNTGTSTGPHLHLTTKNDGKAINPAIILKYIEIAINFDDFIDCLHD